MSYRVLLWQRWIIFNGVGAAGVVVQLVSLSVLLWIGVHYQLATLLAVESAVLHNFFWHERVTWRDRRRGANSIRRLLGFHAANGLVSLLGNLAIMTLLTGGCGVHPLLANAVAIGICSTVNFLLSEKWVFGETGH